MSYKLMEIVTKAMEDGANSVYLAAGQPVTAKKDGSYYFLDPDPLTKTKTEGYVYEAYELAKRPLSLLDENMDDEFAISVSGVSRVCISAFRQRNSYVLTLHAVPFGIPTREEAGIPDEVMKLAELDDGFVLFAGPADGGCPATMACLIEWMNHNLNKYILTVEKPITYMFRNDKSFICQRELGLDVKNVSAALKFIGWQAPDVIMVSDLQDGEGLKALLAAANSQPLALASVTAKNISSAIVNLMNLVPPAERPVVAKDLARELRAIVFQQAVPGADGTVKPQFRLLIPSEKTRKAIIDQDFYLIPCS